MRVARILTAAVAALSVVSMSQVGLAKPAQAAPTGPAISWQYSSEANAYWRPPADTPAPSNDGPLLAWTQYSGQKELTCPDADPAYACSGDPGAALVGIYCSDLPGPTGLPEFAHIRWERTPDPETGEMGLWIGNVAESACEEPRDDDVITMDEIREQMLLEADILHELPQPKPAINPAPTGLVNLPVIVFTDYPNPADPEIGDVVIPGSDPVRLRIRVEITGPRYPFVGWIEAWLDDYVWTFTDGRGRTVETISGRGPGKPYTASVDPRTNPGYYISHTFREAISGNRVSVSMNWVGEVTVPGLDIAQPIEPVPATGTSDPFGVVESEPVLGDR